MSGLEFECGLEEWDCGEYDEAEYEEVRVALAPELGRDMRWVGIVAMVLDF